MSRYGSNDTGGGGWITEQLPVSGGGKSQAAQSVRPVTIKQLTEATQAHSDAVILVTGVEIGTLTFCAQVRNISKAASHMAMTMEDGTGSIEVRDWTPTSLDDSEDPDQKVGGVQERDWVRVVGNIKIFNNKRNVTSHRIIKITDFNEINYHLLDAVRVTLFHERGPPGGAPAAPQRQTNAQDYTHSTTSTSGMAGGGGYAELPTLQRKIMVCITELATNDPQGVGEEGVDIGAVVRSVGATKEGVAAEVEQLIIDGHLYTTSDDEHLLPTGGTD